MEAAQIASFISVAIIAGAVMQWPLGLLSDRIDRRLALAIIAGISAVGGLLMAILGPFGSGLVFAAAIFGAGAFAVYPVIVAHLIDHLHQEEILSGSAALLLLNGIGSAIGPALAGVLMGMIGAYALPLLFAVLFAACAGYALVQSRNTKDEIVEEPGHFVPMVRTSTAMLEMALDDQTGPTEYPTVEDETLYTQDSAVVDAEPAERRPADG